MAYSGPQEALRSVVTQIGGWRGGHWNKMAQNASGRLAALPWTL